MTSRFRSPNSAKYAMRGSQPPHMIFSSYRHARSNHHSPQSACQNRDSHTSTPEMSVLAKRRSANDDTSPTSSLVGSAKPKGPHRIVTLIDSEPNRMHENRGHSSWLDAVLSQIRLHSLRMSLASACKHRVVLRRSGGRRRAAPSNVGHEGAQGALPTDRDTYR